MGLGIYSFWAYRRGRISGVGLGNAKRPHDRFAWGVLFYGALALVPLLGLYAIIRLPTLCYEQGCRVGAVSGAASYRFTSVFGLAGALLLPALATATALGLGIAFLGSTGEGMTVREYFEELEEIDDRSVARVESIDNRYEPLLDAAQSDSEFIDLAARNLEEYASAWAIFRADVESLRPPGDLEDLHAEQLSILADGQGYLDKLASDLAEAATLSDLESILEAADSDPFLDRLEGNCLVLENLAVLNGVTIELDCTEGG